LAAQNKFDPQEMQAICARLPAWLRGEWEVGDAAASPAFPFVCLVHGVGPLLGKVNREQGTVSSKQLSVTSDQSPVSSLQSPHQAWLAQQYEYNQQRLARFHEELHDVLALLARHGIEAMPLKGAVLSLVYYDDPACRPMSDLDLLLPPSQLEKATRLLAQLGYEQESRNWKHITLVKPDNRQVASYDSEHPDNPRQVELHGYCQEMFAGPKVDLTAGMWANSTPGTLLGQPVRLPHPDWLWLHLLLHTSGNIWGNRLRLMNLVDLVRLRPHLSFKDESGFVKDGRVVQGGNSGELRGTQRNSKLETQNSKLIFPGVEARFVYLGAAMVNKVFPEAFPTEWLEKLADGTPRRLRQWADSLDLFSASFLGRQTARPYLWKLTRFYQARPRDMAHIFRFLLTPTDETPLLHHWGRSLWLAGRLLRRGTVDEPDGPGNS
jgi:hypothetical protein